MAENIDISYSNFLKKFPRLDIYKYPRYHDFLLKHGRDDLSWKIHRCGIDAIGLDCTDNPAHSWYTPIPCNRRTCPQCAWFEMHDRINQFSGLERWKDPDMEDANPGFRLRFWTLEPRGVKKGQDFTEHIMNLKKSLLLFWDNVFLNDKRDPYKHSGGIWFFEVQGESGWWNPHIHALVWSPWYNVNKLRKVWKKIINRNGIFGERLRVENLYGDIHKVIREIVAYPLDPNKKGRHDQALMAATEVALSGYRRYILKGSFYGLYPRRKRLGECLICGSNITTGYNYLENHINYKKNYFTEDFRGLYNFASTAYIPDSKRSEILSQFSCNIPTTESLRI